MTAADRQRRYRQRQQAGVRIVRIECDGEWCEALIGAGFLAPGDAEDAEAIKAATERVIEILARRLPVVA